MASWDPLPRRCKKAAGLERESREAGEEVTGGALSAPALLSREERRAKGGRGDG